MPGFFSFIPKFTMGLSGFGLVLKGGQSPEENTRFAYVPFALTVRTGTMVAAAAPGIGKSFTSQVYRKDGLVNTFSGAAMTLSGAGTSVRTTMTGSMPAANPTDTTVNKDLISRTTSGSPADTVVRETFTYLGDVENSICINGAGTNTNNFAGSGLQTDYYRPNNTTAIRSTIESQVQVLWPVSGKFKFFLVQGFSFPGASTSYEFALRVNAVDAILISVTLTSISDPTIAINTSSVASVNGGDLVSIRATRLSGSGTFVPLFVFGFSSNL